MSDSISRRELLKKASVSLLGGSFVLAGAEEQALADVLQKGDPLAEGPLLERQAFPKGKIRDLEFSRMILGGNLIGGWAHARDLIYVSELFRAYNTDEKIMHTLRLAEAHGIDTVLVTPTEMHYIDDYLTRFGGRMQTMVQVMDRGEGPYAEIDKAFEYGADTMYVQGAYADRLVKAGKMDTLVDVLERIQVTGCPGGVGAHALTVIEECERLMVETDYYVKTLHPDRYWSAHPRENRHEFEVDSVRSAEHGNFHDNIYDLFPEKTIEFMKTVEKPWVAFKVLAAGAIHPKEGFRFAFENGADFVAVGMFDFQVAEDVSLALQALEGVHDRDREWRA